MILSLLKDGFFMWQWRVILFSIDRPNANLLFRTLSKINQDGALFLKYYVFKVY